MMNHFASISLFFRPLSLSLLKTEEDAEKDEFLFFVALFKVVQICTKHFRKNVHLYSTLTPSEDKSLTIWFNFISQDLFNLHQRNFFVSSETQSMGEKVHHDGL